MELESVKESQAKTVCHQELHMVVKGDKELLVVKNLSVMCLQHIGLKVLPPMKVLQELQQ